MNGLTNTQVAILVLIVLLLILYGIMIRSILNRCIYLGNRVSYHMSFKKEFIVSKIEIPEDKSSYVYVSIYSKGNFYPSRRQQGFPENQFGVAAIPITSLDDLKNLPKKISDAIDSAFGGGKNNISAESTILKMNAREFNELGIKTGDKVMVEIKISDRNDIQP